MCIDTLTEGFKSLTAPTPDASVSADFVDKAYGPFPSASPTGASGTADAGKTDIGKMIGYGGLAAQVAGVFTGASAAKGGADARAAAQRYNANLADNDATVKGYQETVSRQNAQQAEQKVRLDAARLASAQRARFSAAGLDMTEGTPFNILADTKFMSEWDARTVAANYDNEAWAIRESAKGSRSSANLMRWSADQEQRAGGSLATGTLLSGAGTVASTWYRLNKGLAV